MSILAFYWRLFKLTFLRWPIILVQGINVAWAVSSVSVPSLSMTIPTNQVTDIPTNLPMLPYSKDMDCDYTWRMLQPREVVAGKLCDQYCDRLCHADHAVAMYLVDEHHPDPADTLVWHISSWRLVSILPCLDDDLSLTFEACPSYLLFASLASTTSWMTTLPGTLSLLLLGRPRR